MTTEATDTMASRLRLRLKNFTGDSPGILHLVQCEVCGDRCGGGIDFPLISAAYFKDSISKYDPGHLAPTMSWRQFAELVERARLLYRDPTLELMPNSSLGPIEIEPIGMWPKILKDIDEASPGGLLFSVKLINSLKERGFQLPFQSVILQNRKGFPFPYGIMQPRLYRMLHPETFVEQPNYSQCATCGNVKAVKPGKAPRCIFLKGEFRHTVEPLFRVVGFERCVFVSESLQIALNEIQPSGLEFEPFGVWKE